MPCVGPLTGYLAALCKLTASCLDDYGNADDKHPFNLERGSHSMPDDTSIVVLRWSGYSAYNGRTQGLTMFVLLQYNFLNEKLPQYDDLPRRLLRSAVIGFSASAISDTCSNSVRVVKTSKQTATTPMTYPEVVRVSAHCLLLSADVH